MIESTMSNESISQLLTVYPVRGKSEYLMQEEGLKISL